MKGKSVLINFGLLLASLTVSLFFAEGVVRLMAPQIVQPRFTINSGFGVRVPAENKSYRHSVPGEYAVTINTNDFGGRGVRNYAKQRRSGVSRVCLLGDSFAFGYGVNDEEVVSAVLESQLNAMADKTTVYEVLNFGVSGYGQAEELILYLNRVQHYDCDDVFVFYYSNDPGNNVVSSLYKLNHEGAIVRDQDEFLPGVAIQEFLYGIPILGDLIAHSHFWSMIRNRGSAVLHQEMLGEKGLSTYETNDSEAIDLTVGLIGALKSAVELSGSRFFVFVIPDSTLASNYPFERLAYFEQYTIDGRKLLTKTDYYEHDGHWTASGHKKAAAAIKEEYELRWHN